jgi:hypothetical protein
MQLTLLDGLPFVTLTTTYRGLTGILGMDFLIRAGAVLNLRDLAIDWV